MGVRDHDLVSRTNFNKIHASRTVLTNFHESRTKFNKNLSTLLPYPLSLKQRSRETIFISQEKILLCFTIHHSKDYNNEMFV